MIKNEKGQVLLIVVLVMVVALTVGLSVVSRSITNLRTSTEEANSQKALAAAEAGIEQAIKSNQIGINVASGTFTDTKASYQTSVTAISGTSLLVNGGNPILQDNGADLWLSDYSSNPANLFTSNLWSGNLTIKWGVSSDSCSNAAIEFVLIYGSKGDPKIKRYAFDPCSTLRTPTNHFSPPTVARKTTTLGKDFYYEAQIPVSSGLIGRVVPLYTNTPIALVSNDNIALPSQGSTVTSVGTSGETQRKVNVFQGYPEIPSEYFQNILFSP